MNDTAIRLDNVGLTIGRRAILNNLTLQVNHGDSLGLVGPNGAGKTTLYRALLGLAKASSGRIEVLGRRMPDRRVLAKIGYMAQSESLYQDLTIRENLRFFARLYNLAGKKLEERIDEVLALVNLEARRDDRVENLSGGMRRRVSLAVAILHQPSVLMLDEPTVGVDPELRVALWNEFMRLNKSGVTILVSTHHLDEANRCQRLALLKEGTLLALAPPEELKRETNTATIEEAFLQLARGSES